MGKKIVFILIVLGMIGYISYQFISTSNSSSGEIYNITTEELAEKLAENDGNAVFIDVREVDEYEAGHIPGVANLPLSILSEETTDFPKDADIYIICRSGNRSMEAAQKLLQYGFEKPINVEGGMLAWRGPVVQ